MNNSVLCDINAVEEYKKNIINYYELQITHFKQLKYKFSKANWNDEKILERINQINDCLSKVADAVAELCDGYHVKIVDNFLEQSREYLNTKTHYPK